MLSLQIIQALKSNSSKPQAVTKSYIPVPAMPRSGEANKTTSAGITIQAGGESYDRAVEKLQSILPRVTNLWLTHQQEFYSPQATEHWEEDLNDFYKQLWDDLPTEYQTKVNQPLGNFLDLNYEEKLEAIECLEDEKVEGLDFDEFSKKSFDKLTKEKQDNIINKGLSLIGSDYLYALMPNPVCKALSDLIKESSKDFLETFRDNRIKYLDKGSAGITFSIDIDGNQFLLKVPISQEHTQAYRTFLYEEKQLKKFEEILSKYSAQNLPEQDFIPRQVKDSNGKYIGIPGKMTVMRFYDGQKILIPTKDDPEENEAAQDYVKMGLDDDFLVDYIDFYLRFTKEGADLNDIAPWNYLHNGASLSFFELAGFDPELPTNPVYKFRSALRREYPEAICIYSLLSSISTFEQEPDRKLQKLIADKAKEFFGIETQEGFFSHKVGQLAKVFQISIKKEVIDLDSLRNGLRNLKDLLHAHEGKFGFKLSPRGMSYLEFLTNLVDSEKFLEEVIA